MADNIAITAGSGTTVATDDVGGAHYQRVKAGWGADGAYGDTSVANPLPVSHGITGIGDGLKDVTTAGTRVVLAASTAAKQVVITANTDNAGVIVVGGTTVVAALSTRQGTPLYAGDSIQLEIDNLNDVNIDSTVSGEGVVYTYTT